MSLNTLLYAIGNLRNTKTGRVNTGAVRVDAHNTVIQLAFPFTSGSTNDPSLFNFTQ